ncbi:hypothetical protein [Sulfurospirillum sp. 1612]|uniref:hypothetical protein n=1 Tax=Sulfurospirillum sp. 1612 TaxID=3094835 RepID=UPI002F92D4DF
MTEKLRDIKGIVAITDYSLYYLIALCVVILILIGLAIYWYLQPRRRKKPTAKALALKKLKNINFENQKEVAYLFCLNSIYFVNEKNEAKYNELVKKLERFKYKKEVPMLDDALKKEIQDFIGRLH